jgi:micrococcal nuclease
MFELLRKIIIGVIALVLGAILCYFLGNPLNRRHLKQKAQEIKEKVEGDKKVAWTGTAVVLNAVKGDRVMVDTEDNQKVMVRLAGIDAPELPLDRFHEGQPFAEDSRDYLTKLVKGKAVTMDILGTDRHRRPLVLLSFDNTLINAKMVEAGLAEAARETSAAIPAKQRHVIENAELKAKQEQLGIWALTNYVRPVEFRMRQNTIVRKCHRAD